MRSGSLATRMQKRGQQRNVLSSQTTAFCLLASPFELTNGCVECVTVLPVFSPPPPETPLKTTDDADDAAGHRSFVSATTQTGFCDWSARYFAQPVMKVVCASAPGTKWASRLCPRTDTGVGQSPALAPSIPSFPRSLGLWPELSEPPAHGQTQLVTLGGSRQPSHRPSGAPDPSRYSC